MPRENATTKAVRLLTEGRVSITRLANGQVDAIVRGDTAGFYEVHYRNGRWECPCHALGRCSHALAVQRVVIVA